MKKYVPSRELCERIPAESFHNSVYAWHLAEVEGIVCSDTSCRKVHSKQWQLIRSSKHRLNEARAAGDLYFPAPTLEEILNLLPKDNAYNDIHVSFSPNGKSAGYHVYYIGDRLRHCYDTSAANAALKLFLKLEELRLNEAKKARKSAK